MFTEHENNGVVYLAADNIETPHAFTTRFGGVSEGYLASLNLGENRGDAPDKVLENYRRLREAVGIGDSPMVFTRQVHGTNVRYVTARDARDPYDAPAPDSDGLVTDEPGTALIIFTADCIPLLFFDPVRRAIGAAHAGWRGTVADIAGETVRTMVNKLGCRAEDIRAAIGPGISACCFEVGGEVPEAVRGALGSDGEKYIIPSKNVGKRMVDLKGVNRALMIRAGVLPENIAVSDECTMCRPDKYWSHRVTRGERGSQGALIMLKGTS